ncbi:hypothetical protein AALP_AA3G121400 [Arabis alpina]|uniref:Acidic protein n=1 Tax=Arabis alpina TaxID=50452 RepID=A0A087H8Q0_ARAAL|nr:hypothetical protein AALP_AA3G121400 [Arabis alpina]
MEGKTVILSVLIMSPVMTQSQIQVEAEICCPSTSARNDFDTCSNYGGGSASYCASVSECKIVDGTCPEGYTRDILENSSETVNEYCKLGCASSVCGALTTLQNSDASEVMNKAVEKCTKACSTFCTKGSKIAVKTA